MRSVIRPLGVVGYAAAMVLLLGVVGSASAQRSRSTPALATIMPPGPAPTGLNARFLYPGQSAIAVNGVTLEWTAAPGAQSYTVARKFAGMGDRKVFTANGTSYIDVFGMLLPPNFAIDYEVFANYADKSPGRTALTIRTPDTHPVSDVTARLEQNGRSVSVSWTNSAAAYAPDHLYFAGVGGTPLSRTVPAGSTSITLSALPAGTYTYAVLGYYSVPGVGVVESNLETAPRFTFRIPHCVLLYRRALEPTQLKPSFWFDPPESLLLARGERRTFITDWKHSRDRGTDAERYGSHLREAKNDGTHDIELSLYNSIAGGVSISVVKPGETKTYLLDLGGVRCLP